MYVLFVENHAVFAKTVVDTFLGDHEVTVVPSVREARRFLGSRTYDVVLVDYDLDDEKGDALVRDLAAVSPRPRVIGVSARPAGNIALAGAGADAVCSKLRFSEIGDLLKQS